MNNITLNVLNTTSISSDKLKPLLGKDRRNVEKDLEKLIRINKPSWDFLGIKVATEILPAKYSLILETSNYSGVVPLRSAGSGLYTGALHVNGRYDDGEDAVSELLPLISCAEFTSEFEESLPIKEGSPLPPPNFIECARFVDIYERQRNSTGKSFRTGRWFSLNLETLIGLSMLLARIILLIHSNIQTG